MDCGHAAARKREDAANAADAAPGDLARSAMVRQPQLLPLVDRGKAAIVIEISTDSHWPTSCCSRHPISASLRMAKRLTLAASERGRSSCLILRLLLQSCVLFFALDKTSQARTGVASLPSVPTQWNSRKRWQYAHSLSRAGRSGNKIAEKFETYAHRERQQGRRQLHGTFVIAAASSDQTRRPPESHAADQAASEKNVMVGQALLPSTFGQAKCLSYCGARIASTA